MTDLNADTSRAALMRSMLGSTPIATPLTAINSDSVAQDAARGILIGTCFKRLESIKQLLIDNAGKFNPDQTAAIHLRINDLVLLIRMYVKGLVKIPSGRDGACADCQHSNVDEDDFPCSMCSLHNDYFTPRCTAPQVCPAAVQDRPQIRAGWPNPPPLKMPVNDNPKEY